ncbi:hypothetical protein [Paenibacillus endoradicis]|uniref:hypothetical protein n=1 Tax=Paenibacillus endoradicis TaxID=2972487 RepID=UPI0021596666|nr:hypothetical protein [Paenibacillus endoradicis]
MQPCVLKVWCSHFEPEYCEISLKADAGGISVVFDLPLDKSKAEPAKAEAYLKELLKEQSADTANEEAAIDNE